MSSTSFGLARIGQIALPVRDLDRAVTFYRDVLGLAFLFRVPNLAFFDCAGVRLMLSPPETAELERHSSIIYFTVEDINSSTTSRTSSRIWITMIYGWLSSAIPTAIYWAL
jgi:catechol 2,3-dioxygenase-like lactoylglutathione lyase family enzyme